jgi:hypothetical protein
MRKIGEPRAGFDLRKRTIGDAFSEGLPIAVWRAMVHDGPMHHTGAAVFLTLDSMFRLDQKEELSMSLPPCPTVCRWETFESHHSSRYSLSLGLFVSSYPVPFDMFLSIRGAFYQRPTTWGAVRRLSSAPPSPQAKSCCGSGSNCCWIYPFGGA